MIVDDCFNPSIGYIDQDPLTVLSTAKAPKGTSM